MTLKEWMVPQEIQFFDLLEREVAAVAEGGEALRHLLDDFRDVPAQRQKVKDIEHRADEIVHKIHDTLNRAFVTPFAKEDLAGIASRLDDVLDYINATVTRLAIYEVDRPTDSMKEFAGIVNSAVDQLRNGLVAVRNRQRDAVLACAIEVNRLENVADDLLNRTLGELLKEKDAIRVIKLKEIYEMLEAITDRCEDVANILEDIVSKGR